MSTKIYVGGLAYETNEQTLKEFFATYGDVESVNIITDRATQRSKGFGFVEMTNSEDAVKAITATNGKDLDGRKLTVNQARPQRDRN